MRTFFFEQVRERAGETDKALVGHYRRELTDYARTIEAVAEQKVGGREDKMGVRGWWRGSTTGVDLQTISIFWSHRYNGMLACASRVLSAPRLCLSPSEQYLRSLDSGDILTEAEKNAVVAKKIGLQLPEVTEFNKPIEESEGPGQYTMPNVKD